MVCLLSVNRKLENLESSLSLSRALGTAQLAVLTEWLSDCPGGHQACGDRDSDPWKLLCVRSYLQAIPMAIGGTQLLTPWASKKTAVKLASPRESDHTEVEADGSIDRHRIQHGTLTIPPG